MYVQTALRTASYQVPLIVTTPHWLGVPTLDLKLTTQEVLAPGCSLGYNVKGKCPSVTTLHSLRPLFYFQVSCPLAKASPYIKKSYDGHSHKYGGHYVFYGVHCAICTLEIMFLMYQRANKRCRCACGAQHKGS